MRAWESLATLGLDVAKSGRSTGLTCSTVLSVSYRHERRVQQELRWNGREVHGGLQQSGRCDWRRFCGGRRFGIADCVAEYGGSGGAVVCGIGYGCRGESGGAGVGIFLERRESDDVCGRRAARGDRVHVADGRAVGGKSCGGCGEDAVVEQSELQRAVAARDARASALLAHPAVQAVGVGASLDNPGEPAIEFFVTRGAVARGIPSGGEWDSDADCGRRFVREARGGDFGGRQRDE